nr:uncharacterized protein LOC117279972 [Nicotiana tomentosiformis]
MPISPVVLSTLQAPSVKRPQVIGSSKEGLYYLCSRCLKGKNTVSNANVSISCCNCSSSTSVNSGVFRSPAHSHPYLANVNTSIHNNKNESSTVLDKHDVNVLWHNRLGHVLFVKMRGISFIPVNFSPKQPFICSICPMARQARLPFPQRTCASTQIFQLLHVDIWPPYHVTTYDNYKYFLTLVDDFSTSTWTHLLQ